MGAVFIDATIQWNHPKWGMAGKAFQIYAPQTKIWEDRTNISEGIFEALFKGVSTLFGLQAVEKCFESAF
jgi:hypothetical protein